MVTGEENVERKRRLITYDEHLEPCPDFHDDSTLPPSCTQSILGMHCMILAWEAVCD